MCSTGTAILNRWHREPGDSHDAGYRRSLNFFSSDSYTTEELEEQLSGVDVQDTTVFAILDTSYFNFDKNIGRLKVNDPNIGYINKAGGVGFGFHVSILVSCDTCLPIGLGGFTFLVRPIGREIAHHKSRPADERESTKWYDVMKSSRERVHPSCKLIFICDREGDVYSCLNRASKLPDTFIVVRLAQNRVVENCAYRRINEALCALPVMGKYNIELREKDDEKARTACLSVSYASFEIACPASERKQSLLDETQTLNVVRVWEEGGNLEWKLYTNMPINCLEDAIRVIYCYKKRWLIEETFRIMKNDGFQTELSQMESGKSLQRLTAIGCKAALRVLALKEGRNLQTPGSVETHFSPLEQQVLKALAPRVQGRKGHQLNPHPPDSLAHAVWIIARLGGWTPGNPKRPPGVITLYRGLKVFDARVEGYALAQDLPQN